MLPATFDNDPKFRVSASVIGIFAVAILAAGFSLTGLLTFAVRNPIFQADAIFLPSLTSCALGILTIFYDFLISSRYVWNTPALLLVIAASLSTIVYSALLLYTQRKIGKLRSRGPSMLQDRETSIASDNGNHWQDAAYYENYIRNMFPASAHQETLPLNSGVYDLNSITEEEMQRQQMLMLLLHREPVLNSHPSHSTFQLDWQGQDQDDLPPAHGYYAPGQLSNSTTPSSAYPLTGITRQWTDQDLQRPWDGVWRGPGPAPAPVLNPGRGRPSIQEWSTRETSRERREERRREIEQGR